jgi:hypothetical protein
MAQANLYGVERLDRISLGLKKNRLKNTVVGYLYQGSDELGIYVHAFLSDEAMNRYYNVLDSMEKSESNDGLARIVLQRETCLYFFPWTALDYVQLS